MNYRSSTHYTGVLAAMAFTTVMLMTSAMAADIPEELEEYEPPPEGYVEVSYPVHSLMYLPRDCVAGDLSSASGQTPLLSTDGLQTIIRTCVQPESWKRRGHARMRFAGQHLVVLHKKEVHAEIARVLAWLRKGTWASFHATVVVSALKPAAIKQLVNGPRAISAQELNKLMAAEGEDTLTQILELRGIEGQKVFVNGSTRRSYIGDYDVSGAVFDPVMRSANSGLRASVSGSRCPDGKSALVDLKVAFALPPKMEKARINIADAWSFEVPDEDDDEKEAAQAPKAEPKKAGPKGHPGHELGIQLPVQAAGRVNTSLLAPRGMFAIAGVMDLRRADPAFKDRLCAVFVRVVIGGEEVPTLENVSGLQAGEQFKLYRLSALSHTIKDYPSPEHLIPPIDGFDGSSYASGAPINPFCQAQAAVARGPLRPVAKAQAMFHEKVRKNKIVDVNGPFLFTRLKAEDHKKLITTLMGTFNRAVMPTRFHTRAIAVSRSEYLKFVLQGKSVLDAADVDALAAVKGSEDFASPQLSLLANQRAHLYSGNVRHTLQDYEISGDSYDPVVRPLLERGSILDIRSSTSPDSKTADVTGRFYLLPEAAAVDRNVLDAISVNQGANASLILRLKADLALIKQSVVVVSGSASVPLGKYGLLGSARMPEKKDGTPDTRQLMLFVKAIQ